MSGEDGYKESVGQYSDLKPALNASQPVHTVTENIGDSESIASAIAERATGNPDGFETRENAMASEDTANDVKETISNAAEKIPEPSPDMVDNAEKTIIQEAEGLTKSQPGEDGGFTPPAILLISGAVLVVGGILGAIFQLTKKKSVSA